MIAENLFYITSLIAILAAVLAITRLNAIHALLYLIVTLFALAIDFYLLGAPFAAALEIIIYAGAMMVLFVFAIMILNQGIKTVDDERKFISSTKWKVPCLFAAILLAELIYLLTLEASTLSNTVGTTTAENSNHIVNIKSVGVALFGPYLIVVELASLLLLAGLVGAFHLSRPMARKADHALHDFQGNSSQSANNDSSHLESRE